MTRLISGLLLLFPAQFRDRYGPDMEATFRDQWTAATARGAMAATSCLLRTVVSLVMSALGERVTPPTTSPLLYNANHRGSGGFMDQLQSDIAYALRFLRRQPAFTTIVLLTLGLGIGMTTAVFSVLYGVLYQPLPYQDEGSIVRVGRTHPSLQNVLLPLSPAAYLDLRSDPGSLTMLEAESSRGFVLTDRGDAGQHAGGVTSAGFFDLYGVAPRLGRTFQATDDTPGAEAVVVVSDAFWRTQLGADPGIVGTSIRLNDEPHTVIGVMPPLFQPGGAALWVTLRMSDTQRAVRNSNFLRLVGRLSPGTDAAQAGAELEAKWRPIREAFPRGNEDTGLTATPLRELIAQRSRTPLLILAGAAGFVLLIACANVANLMLVRAERRQREVGVRAALGARRGRLARQFLTEGLLISLLGGAIGVVVAYGGVRWLLGTFASAVPRAQEIGISLPVLGFTLLASMVTGVLVGLAPALRSRPDFEILREGSRGGTARFTRIGKSLVVAEVALALMLVTGAGLLLKSYARAVDSDLGFDARGLAAVSLWFPQSRYTDNAQRQIFMDQLVSDLTAHSAIEAVALANMVPIREFGNNWTEVAVAGRDDAKAAFVEARNVSPSYFATMGIPLLSGRLFTEEEARADGGSNVVVINRTLARQLFGDSAALGWQLAIAQQPPEIIGVVEDVRDLAPDQPSRPMIYFGGVQGGNLMVRSAGGSATAVDAVRNAVLQIDAEVAVIRFDTMEQVLDQALSGRRFQLALIGVFALTALILACVGIYGVLSYSVERQTREIGVRMALGAHAGRVAALVAWRGGRLALIGVVLGLGGALALRRAIAAQLFEVGTFDPMVYLGVSGLLLAVAGLASFLPARRAALVLPTQALRTE